MIYGYHLIGKNNMHIIVYPVLLLEKNNEKYLIYKRTRDINGKTYIGIVKEKNEVVPIEEVVMKYYNQD
ncbi:MAG: hypothetical protein IKD77_03730 [Bacilli bacterium]|nr:hypothetical protein [Bacilli bacterium]